MGQEEAKAARHYLATLFVTMMTKIVNTTVLREPRREKKNKTKNANQPQASENPQTTKPKTTNQNKAHAKEEIL